MTNTPSAANTSFDAAQSPAQTNATPRAMLWTGYLFSGIVVLFMLMDSVMKILQLPVVIETTAQLGYAHAALPPRTLGWMFLVFTALYAIRRTAVLGAILLTAVMGGAIATHVRVGSPVFTHILFGVYLAIFTWGGLYLRDAQVRALLPFRR